MENRLRANTRFAPTGVLRTRKKGRSLTCGLDSQLSTKGGGLASPSILPHSKHVGDCDTTPSDRKMSFKQGNLYFSDCLLVWLWDQMVYCLRLKSLECGVCFALVFCVMKRISLVAVVGLALLPASSWAQPKNVAKSIRLIGIVAGAPQGKRILDAGEWANLSRHGVAESFSDQRSWRGPGASVGHSDTPELATRQCACSGGGCIG